MDYEVQLKLQAFLDGELPGAEVNALAGQIAQDREATALLAELRRTRDTMRGNELGVSLPESREFFWSKIQRDIERAETPSQEAAPAPWLLRVRRFLMPASALTAFLLAGLLAFPHRVSPPQEGEMTIADSGAFTYRDFETGATLVWLSYPAENELAQK